jgi:hypothetical protein
MAALNFGPTVSATSLVAVLLELNKLTKKSMALQSLI